MPDSILSFLLSPIAIFFLQSLALFYGDKTGFLCSAVRYLLFRLPVELILYSCALTSLISGSFGEGGVLFSVTLCASVMSALGGDPREGVVLGYSSALVGGYFSFPFSPTAVFMSSVTLSLGASDKDIYSLFLPSLLIPLLSLLLFPRVCKTFTSRMIKRSFSEYGLGAEDSALKAARLLPPEIRGLKCAAAALVLCALLLLGGFLLDSYAFKIPARFLYLLLFFVGGTAYGVGAESLKDPGQWSRALHSDLPSSALPASSLFQLTATALPISPPFRLMTVALPISSLFWLIAAPLLIPPLEKLGITAFEAQLLFGAVVTLLRILSPLSLSFLCALRLFNFYSERKRKKAGALDFLSLLLPYAFAFAAVSGFSLIISRLAQSA